MANQEVLKMNNMLITSKHDLSKEQFRFYMILLYEFQKQKSGLVKQDTYLKINISNKEFKRAVKNKNFLTFNGVMNFLYEFKHMDFRYELKNTSKVYSSGFISSYCVDKETLDIEVDCSTTVLSFFQSFLDKNYTLIDINDFLSIKGIYTKRFYLLLKQYANTGYFTIGIDELKDILSIDGISRYKTFGQINDRIIKVAIKELTEEKQLFKFEYEVIKDKRQVVRIEFKEIEDLNPSNYKKINAPIKNKFKQNVKVDFSHYNENWLDELLDSE